MKNGIRNAVIIGLLAVVMPAISQRNEVFYNLFNDSVTYKRDGKPVESLRLRKGDEVRIHLTEFNPFTSDVQLEVVEVNDYSGFELTGMAGMDGLLTGLPTGLGDILAGGSGAGVPAMDIPVLTVGDDTLSIQGLFGTSRGGAEVSQANVVMQEISGQIAEAKSLYEQLQAVEKAALVSSLALVYVEPLRQQPNIQPSVVKRLCREYYDAIFQKSANEELSLNDLLTWQGLPARQSVLLQKIKAKQGELSGKIGVLEGITKVLSNNPTDNASGQQYLREMIDFQVKARGVRDQLKEIASLPAGLENLPSLQQMAELQLQLAEVISNDFTYHTTLQPTSDQVNLNIKLQRKSAGNEEPELIKERHLRLEVRGGMRVRASAGMGFGQFFEPGQSYSVSNGVIVGEDEGAFSPSLVSFLHFHGYRGQRATLGGTFGAGFPLLANGDGQSIEFYIGPSLMVGAAQKLVISAGLKGGRAQRLAKGYELGDVFDANFGDIPTVGKYAFGVFLGASFNLGN